jgi:mono/diheme cytochrome c family protein
MGAIRSKAIALFRGRARIGLSSLVLVLAAGLACATAREEPPIPNPDPLLVKVGAELFVTYCASCHGADALGDGPAAFALSPSPPDLTRIAERSGGEFPESSIAMKIDGRFDLPTHGSREMPIWGARLADEMPGFATGDEVARGRIASLMEYLRSLQQQ